MIQLKILYDLRNKESYPFIDFIRFLKRNLPLTDMIEFDKIDFNVHYSTVPHLIISTSNNMGSHDLH